MANYCHHQLNRSEVCPSYLYCKMSKYLCTIINELGIIPQGPIMIYKDNTATIMMTNTNKPNGYTRHIDINYFALQEWAQGGELKLAHI
eukprot:12218278-Ditylum_brightwellii.AAC.1